MGYPLRDKQYYRYGEYRRWPGVQELAGETAVGVLPGVTIRWEPVVSRLLPAGSDQRL